MTKAPTHICCDNCSKREMNSESGHLAAHSCTPNVLTDSSEEHITPSKSMNANRKHSLWQSKDGLSTWHGDHLHTVRAALERWHFKVKRDRYTLGSVNAE